MGMDCVFARVLTQPAEGFATVFSAGWRVEASSASKSLTRCWSCSMTGAIRRCENRGWISTTGVLHAAMLSLAESRPIKTPYLDVRYEPTDRPHAPGVPPPPVRTDKGGIPKPSKPKG